MQRLGPLFAFVIATTSLVLGQVRPYPKPQIASANHLIAEKSPYLLLHAHNPVDWYPWGEEAFARARRENKPIFLSIGYYTCHWCRDRLRLRELCLQSAHT
jgi:hypothetical protein